jgi:hypothetical protein
MDRLSVAASGLTPRATHGMNATPWTSASSTTRLRGAVEPYCSETIKVMLCAASSWSTSTSESP